MFKNIYRVSVLASLLLFVMTGCSYKKISANTAVSDEVVKEYSKVQTAKQHLEVAQDMQNNVTTQRSLEATIASLSTQIMQNRKLDTNKPVLITSFVRLDKLKETSEFGRVIGESMINELSNRGFNVIEYRGQMAVSINDQGEYFISRKPHELKGSVPSTYVVVGTYSRQAGRVILNARVIDNITGKIISSARSTYKHGLTNDCIMFGDCAPARTIKIVKER
jgi:TolB-like protein